MRPAKRILDLLISVPLLILLSPVMLIVALSVAVVLGRPIFFTQWRAGFHGKPFRIYKFRTMTDERDAAGNLLPNEDRLTPFGRFLRSTSLDELPELWNVIRGEMSLVGPRPLLMEYLNLYTPEQARRHEMPPGITGWAQVNGRNALSWEEKFRLDTWYIDNWSIWLDLKILWMTFATVITRRGISAEGYATMPRFTGTGVLDTGPSEIVSRARKD